MQQYFVDYKLNVGETIPLDKEVLYHTKKVLRKDDGYTFRICDVDHHIFVCELKGEQAIVKEDTNENNELDVDITVIMSLIKPDKWDFTIQKLTELGVKRIVPYCANRCVVKASDDKKLERYRKIVREASEQCRRNLIPEITPYAKFKDIDKYLSKNNYIAYEKQNNDDIIDGYSESVTIVIGPEGGFESGEIENFFKKGFKPISLGKRILRAETAAIFAVSYVESKTL